MTTENKEPNETDEQIRNSQEYLLLDEYENEVNEVLNRFCVTTLARREKGDLLATPIPAIDAITILSNLSDDCIVGTIGHSNQITTASELQTNLFRLSAFCLSQAVRLSESVRKETKKHHG